ncbi:hypothetical protein [Halobaculum sp. CBA1158]|nr:hypothetical protein [Halobaculum sp. CBA1158]
MATTTYRVHGAAGVYTTDIAWVAEAFATDGLRVTAVTEGSA